MLVSPCNGKYLKITLFAYSAVQEVLGNVNYNCIPSHPPTEALSSTIGGGVMKCKMNGSTIGIQRLICKNITFTDEQRED